MSRHATQLVDLAFRPKLDRYVQRDVLRISHLLAVGRAFLQCLPFCLLNLPDNTKLQWCSSKELGRLNTTVDGRNIQALSTTWTPSIPKLNVRGLARMFRRTDETNQALETQVQFNQVMFNIDLWRSGVGDSYWYMGLNIWSIYCLKLWRLRVFGS